MSGLTLLGAATGVGGAATWVIGQTMSQRTPNGAYVDAMLKAFRRTLQKTMEQARSMEQVVADPTVKLLADTPDKAVVWGFALGLHDEVAEGPGAHPRGPGERIRRRASGAYYPLWLGGGSPLVGGWLPGWPAGASSRDPACRTSAACSAPSGASARRPAHRRRAAVASVVAAAPVAEAAAEASEPAAGAPAIQRLWWGRCHTNDDLTDAPAAADPAAPDDHPATARASATVRSVTAPASATVRSATALSTPVLHARAAILRPAAGAQL